MTETGASPINAPHGSGLSLNCRGLLLDLSRPVVMGILNVTPDSFYDGGRTMNDSAVLKRAELLLEQGAAIIDIGAVSSKPGSQGVPIDVERKRLLPVLKAVVGSFPGALISVDTWRSEIARESADAGACIINDISGGQLDPRIIEVAIENGMPYVLMHMAGTPATMQENPRYSEVGLEVMKSLQERMYNYRQQGLIDIIVDPGFGFGKTITDNFRLLDSLHTFQHLSVPILAGLSRKSMIHRTLHTDAAGALNGTTALNMIALQKGASILRVHDVREARECILLHDRLQHSKGGSSH